MSRQRVVAAIDVGTTKVCTLVGQINRRGEAQIIGVGVAPSKGLRKGIVVDMDEAVEAIRSSVEKAERSSGFKVVSARIGLTGTHVTSINNRGVVAVTRADRVITSDDVMRAIESAKTVNVPANREIIHIIPRSFTIDGQEGVKNPVGLHGFRLDVETHIITASSTAVQNLVRSVERVGVEVDDVILEPIASSEAVISEEEREMGVAVADIGGGTTDIAVYLDGSIYHTKILPVGGYHLTNDIAIGLRTPFAAAEQIKKEHAEVKVERTIDTVIDHPVDHAVDLEQPDPQIQVEGFGTDSRRAVSRRQLSEIVEARASEIIEMIVGEIRASGYNGPLPAGLVLCGGTANLVGIGPLAEDIMGLPVRIGHATRMYGLTEAIRSPAYATGVGLLLWAARREEAPRKSGSRRAQSAHSVTRRVMGWIRELLPE